jgi:hypothetical protein
MPNGWTGRAAGWLCIALVLAPTVTAQVDTGTILGTVYDATGAVIPGAQVTITHEGTGVGQIAESRSDGTYIFTPVRIGSYTIEVEVTGFQRARRMGATVSIQQQRVVDFQLSPGEITETINVEAVLPTLQTQDASVGEVVGARAINNLPLSGRNYNFLARLTAGVTHSQPEGRGLAATGWFAANGTRPAQNNFLLDGIDNNSNNVDFLSGAAYVVRPPVDAIGEFKLQTNSFSAEFGRAGGAVLNASLKSGTNEFHGSAWEFLRNDNMDAADFFQNANRIPRGEFKQNQFGVAAGGPIVRNKTFIFGDYEGTRIRQAAGRNGTVPTALQRASGFTDFSDLIVLQSGTRTDAAGRTFPLGTVFDPSTTRQASGGYVREPFENNRIPASRLSPNAVKLLELYPSPTSGTLANNYFANRPVTDNVDSFDVRVDHLFSERDSVFGRYSLADATRFRPAPFDGVADGGGFADGDETLRTQGAALSYTRTFSPTLINEVRVGFNREHSLRLQPFGDDTSNIPAQFGIQGIPQEPGNGGLPRLNISGLSALGGSDWLISERFSNTYQISENLTKIYGSHTFKGGWEGQLIDFPWIAPPFARGSFQWNGAYTSIPNVGDGSTGRAQFLLAPTNTDGAGGIGPSQVQASNFGWVASRKYYTGLYFQDDWKINSKLTLNLGLRWDHFGLVGDRYDAQGNFSPDLSNPVMYYTERRGVERELSAGFREALARDGIELRITDEFGSGFGQAQKLNLAPRFGFAYRVTDNLVVRGGYGIYYGAFENRGGFPSLGYNYPFQYDFSFFRDDDVSPVRFADGTFATLERGLSSVPLQPLNVSGFGLNLRGIEFDYKTPYVQSYNFTIQYQLAEQTTFEVGYVGSLSRHLESFTGANRVNVILPPGTNQVPYTPWPSFARNSSYATTQGNAHYHSMQTKFTRRLSKGLEFLATYTWAKTLTNSGDLLSGGNVGGFRAPNLPDFGIRREMGLASFHVEHAFTFSGTYELPFGRGRSYLTDPGAAAQAILGGWSINWITTMYSGQPQSIGCTISTSIFGCYPLLTGENLYFKEVGRWYNAAAFKNPPVATQIGQSDFAPLGGYRTPVTGPPLRKLDFSLFKSFHLRERYRFEFRAEAFNLTNTPALANPAFTNFADQVSFGRITSTRNSPNDARQVQLALKFYW